MQTSLMAPRPTTDVQIKPIRMLMVEDCLGDVQLVRHMLKVVASNDSFDITSVPRLTDAFKTLDEESYDVVLLDLNLLDMDGIACVAALHAQVPNTPIIVYSGSDDPKIKEEALKAGAKHFLVKGKESGYSIKFVIENTREVTYFVSGFLQQTGEHGIQNSTMPEGILRLYKYNGLDSRFRGNDDRNN